MMIETKDKHKKSMEEKNYSSKGKRDNNHQKPKVW
jgi:hypothetical protein